MSRRTILVTLAAVVAMVSGCDPKEFGHRKRPSPVAAKERETIDKRTQEAKAFRGRVAKSDLPAVASFRFIQTIRRTTHGAPISFTPAVRVCDRNGRWAVAKLLASEDDAAQASPPTDVTFHANTGRWFVYGDPEYAEALVRLCEQGPPSGDVGAR